MNKDTPTTCTQPPPYGWDNPQQTYPQPPPPSQEHIIVMPTRLGPEPQRMMCPFCRTEISSRIETEASMKTHMFAFLLCIFGLWCCVPCPYCMDSCLDTKHYCPACSAYLGTYQK